MTDSPGLAIKIQQKLKLQIKVLLSSLWCVFYRFSLHFHHLPLKKKKLGGFLQGMCMLLLSWQWLIRNGGRSLYSLKSTAKSCSGGEAAELGHRSARKKNLLGSRGEAAEFAATQKDTELTANKTGSKVWFHAARTLQQELATSIFYFCSGFLTLSLLKIY